LPRRAWRALVVSGLLLSWTQPADAQANRQLWGNVTLDWVKSERLVYELDFEPKVLLAAPEGEPGWRNIDLTPNVEYSPKGWLDLVSEAVIGYTIQTDDVNSIEVTPRLGVRFHLFSRALPTIFRGRELPPKRRIVVRDLARVESRNIFYTGAGSGSDSTVRFRNRLEFLVPLNKEKLSEDGARYSRLGVVRPARRVDERLQQTRIRTGLGYNAASHGFEVSTSDAIMEHHRGKFSTADNGRHPAEAAVLNLTGVESNVPEE
jgi:hypothetical protein